jgi:hypothetical protein
VGLEFDYYDITLLSLSTHNSVLEFSSLYFKIRLSLNLLRLSFQTESLFFPHYRMKYIEEDTAIWMKRPLTPELELGVLCDVVYLLDLQKATMDALLGPVNDITKILLSDLCDVSNFTMYQEPVHPIFCLSRPSEF